jgi:hypothetical protein
MAAAEVMGAAVEEPSVVVVAEDPWAAAVAREAMPPPVAVMVTAVMVDIAVGMDSVAAMDTVAGAGAVGAWASVIGPGITATDRDTDVTLTLTGTLIRVIQTHTTHRITEIQRQRDIRLRTDIRPLTHPTDTIRMRTLIPVPELE